MRSRSPRALVCILLLGCAVTYPATAIADTTRLETVRLLRARSFARLDEIVERAHVAADRDVRSEPQLVRILSAFESTDPVVTALLDEWAVARPSSAAARLARAQHHLALADGARAVDTNAPDSSGLLQARLQQVVRDAEETLKWHRASSAALEQLLHVAMVVGGAEACTRVWESVRHQSQTSWLVWNRLMHCFRARSGGSNHALEALVEQLATHQVSNPHLRALAGMVPFDLGSVTHDVDRSTAIRLYTRAIELGDHGLYRHWRARAYVAQRRYQEAFVDIERSLELVPEDVDSLVIRAWAARALGRPSDAAADIRLVSELDPLNDLLAQLKDEELDTAIPTARRLMNERAYTEAIDRLSRAIAIVGDDPEALMLRGRAKLTAGDSGAALPDLERALALEPGYFDAVQVIGDILVGRAEYQKAARYWTNYLKREPTNGRALLARARVYFGRGDRAPGLADANAACRAGLLEGCALAVAIRP